MSVPGEKKINRKRLEHLERCRRKEEAKNTKSKLKKLARIVERKKQKQTRDSLIEQLSQFQHTAFTNLIPTAKMHLKCYQSEPDREIDSNVSSSVKFPKKLRCVSGSKLQSLATARKRQQENYYETGSSSDGEDGPSADRNASDFVLLDEFKKEPLDGVDADDTLADAFASARAPTTKTKLMICKNNDIVDEQVKRSCEEQNAMAKMLAKIKGAKVVVPRLDAIEAQRRKLPIHAEEQEIVEAINENEVVVICGETGSGKTTQIPQFLYEAGYTSNGHLIGVTEPRRIAAISMAERVGRELCAPELSAYQIRFEGNRTERTKLLFVTDGVLLRELQTDPMLLRFSVIVIDEAHERSVYSDVLIGLLSRISIARQKSGIPLKLIIMSATLRLSDFFHRRLFPQTEPKVIEVNARQFDVTIHFERCTPRDYLKAAFRKVCKIHRRLPEGGILVFLSGQREVEQLIRRLAARFPKTNTDDQQKADAGEKTKKRKRTKRKTKANNSSCDEDLVVDYEEFGAADADPKSSVDERTLFHDAQSDENDSDDDDDDELMDELASGDKFLPLHCLPLYSLLSSERQRKVFEPVPQGHRSTKRCKCSVKCASQPSPRSLPSTKGEEDEEELLL